MSEKSSTEQKNQTLFIQLILTFQTAAWQQMGKLKNPLTNKIEKNLEQARMSIDMLDMLKAKTEGNRNDEETRLLERIISELKLNFVDELEKARKEEAEKAAKTEEKQVKDQKNTKPPNKS